MSNAPKIDYPCPWSYQIIGTDVPAVTAFVAETLGDRSHQLEERRQSRGGRFVSLHLTVVVDSDADRVEIYESLLAHDAVRLIL